jgi:copper chaperone
METMTIKVGGMTCGGCVASVTRVLAALDGVTKVDVSLEQGQAVIEVDTTRVRREQVLQAIEDAGFEAS